jgi:hypothetical protein
MSELAKTVEGKLDDYKSNAQRYQQSNNKEMAHVKEMVQEIHKNVKEPSDMLKPALIEIAALEKRFEERVLKTA